jgi:hypothetical protein
LILDDNALTLPPPEKNTMLVTELGLNFAQENCIDRRFRHSAT